MESSFLRFQETRCSRAQVSKAIKIYLFADVGTEFNNVNWSLENLPRLEINPIFEASKL